MSFKIKNFLRFSNKIYFHFRFTFGINILFGIFCWETWNCHNSEPVRGFDLIPTLKAMPKYQLTPGSLVVEDYTQHWWDYAQLNGDWRALENPPIDTLDPNFEKTTMTTYKSKYISKLVRPRLILKCIHIKPLKWHSKDISNPKRVLKFICLTFMGCKWVYCKLVDYFKIIMATSISY